MADNNLYAALSDDTVMVTVKYSGKEYSYKASRRLELKVGDAILAHFGDMERVLYVERVEENKDFLPDVRYKWVSARIDKSLHDQCVEREKTFNREIMRIQREKKRNEIKDELEKSMGLVHLTKLLSNN